jgi:hypothetical protein
VDTRVVPVAAVILTVLGIGTVIVGTALYIWGPLAFPSWVNVAVVAVEIGLGTIPCMMLVRAARLWREVDENQTRYTSIASGLLLLPGIGVVALFRVFANPCWDNPTCTGGSSIEDSVLLIGIVVLLLAAVVAILLLPVMLTITARSRKAQ